MKRVNQKFFALNAVLLLICLLPAITQAQSSGITIYAGGFLGDSFISKPAVLFPEVQAVFDDDFTGGFRYAYFLNSFLAGEVGFGITPSSIVSRGSFSDGTTSTSSVISVDTYIFQANLVAHMFRGPIIPYVTGGVGAVHFNFDTSQFGFVSPSETDFAWNAGGGFKIPFRHNAAIRLDGRFYWLKPEFSVDDTSRFVELSGGVSILFDW